MRGIDMIASGQRRTFAVGVSAALVYFALGYGSILLTRNGYSVSLLWPGNAVILCMLQRLCRGPRDDAAVLIGVFLAGLPANLLGGSPLFLTAAFSAINVVEIATGCHLVRSFAPARFVSVSAGLRFGGLAGLLTPMVGASLAALMTFLSNQPDVVASARNWYFADVLGFFIVAPFGMTLSLRELRKLRVSERLVESALVFSAVLIVSLGVFTQESYPLLFLIFPVCLLATYRFRLIGAGIAMAVVSAIAIPATQFGYGAMQQVAAGDTAARSQIIQLFLAVCCLTCVLLGALLNERDVHIEIIERRKQRAMAANRFKTQLLSHVSHEARSPLSAIIGLSAMLESGSLSAEKSLEFFSAIARNGELLTRLHDDLLDLTRAELGALAISAERVPVGAVLTSLLDDMRPSFGQADSSTLVLETVEDALAIYVDPLRLAQIVNNLVGNAKKYSDENSPIFVTARKLDDGFGRIEVRNSGPGISPEHRVKIFEPFTRLDASKPHGGTGLGLSITKMLVEIQGGRIDFESVPGQQTSFWVDLPLAA